MICYKDITFCTFFPLCKNGHKCKVALTEKIKNDAVKWWGDENAPICIYSDFPDCFIRWFEGENKS